MRKYGNKPIEKIKWTQYKIVVPTEKDKKELESAFEHIHYSDINTNYVAVNQLAHEYLTPERTGDNRTKNNIIIDKDLYCSLRGNSLEPEEASKKIEKIKKIQ